MPKWSQNGSKREPKMCLKWRFRHKSANSGLDPLFTIYTHYRHPPKTSLFDTSRQAKCRSFSGGASDAALGLQSGAHGAEKWREWGPPGTSRVPKGPPMPPKMLQKIVANQPPSPGRPRVLLGCLGYPNASKIRPFLTFPRPTLPHVGGTFTSSLLYPTHLLPRTVKHPSSAAVWAYAHLDCTTCF